MRYGSRMVSLYGVFFVMRRLICVLICLLICVSSGVAVNFIDVKNLVTKNVMALIAEVAVL